MLFLKIWEQWTKENSIYLVFNGFYQLQTFTAHISCVHSWPWLFPVTKTQRHTHTSHRHNVSNCFSSKVILLIFWTHNYKIYLTNFSAEDTDRIRRSVWQPVYRKLSKYKWHFWSFAIVFAEFQVSGEEEWGWFPVRVPQPNIINKDGSTCAFSSLYMITIRRHESYWHTFNKTNY